MTGQTKRDRPLVWNKTSQMGLYSWFISLLVTLLAKACIHNDLLHARLSHYAQVRRLPRPIGGRYTTRGYGAGGTRQAPGGKVHRFTPGRQSAFTQWRG